MTSTKKSKGQGKAGKALSTAYSIVTALKELVPPEVIDASATWLRDQHFSDKFVTLTKKIHLPESKNPFETIGLQCDAVEELIETKSSELADDAPIDQWRLEVGKIRRGAELLNKASERDHKKIRFLQQRAQKLLNSAFDAAAN